MSHPTPRPHPLVDDLTPLLARAVAAEADHRPGFPSEDLTQDVWLRLFEHLDAAGPPVDPARWVRAAVRAEAHRARCAARRELPCGTRLPVAVQGDPEDLAFAADLRRSLRAAVRRLPSRCRGLVLAFLSPDRLTYREIAGELGISQGSLGPERSRCLGCLRRMLAAEVAVPDPRGRVR
ncbi:sigma-70 family RNA polymerase sigma factor [Streptomyces sp. NPDC005955]|uniref:RNA polymerase sigma factor n=1 Tax=Streptomyces sp. NPDC005955 TaxID=3364738 RepID=UPI00367A6850